jgi:hypothetical protein
MLRPTLTKEKTLLTEGRRLLPPLVQTVPQDSLEADMTEALPTMTREFMSLWRIVDLQGAAGAASRCAVCTEVLYEHLEQGGYINGVVRRDSATGDMTRARCGPRQAAVAPDPKQQLSPLSETSGTRRRLGLERPAPGTV